MIDTIKFVNFLHSKKISFFCGVPDSCVNEFCNELNNQNKKVENILIKENAGRPKEK